MNSGSSKAVAKDTSLIYKLLGIYKRILNKLLNSLKLTGELEKLSKLDKTINFPFSSVRKTFMNIESVIIDYIEAKKKNNSDPKNPENELRKVFAFYNLIDQFMAGLQEMVPEILKVPNALRSSYIQIDQSNQLIYYNFD